MEETLNLRLVAPGRTIFDGDVESTIIPATDGLMGILPGHAPFLGLLAPGEVTVRRAGTLERFPVQGGIVQVLPDRVIILAEDTAPTPKPAT
jgi:F-type H+-transporting ATPase subunit epsilon